MGGWRLGGCSSDDVELSRLASSSLPSSEELEDSIWATLFAFFCCICVRASQSAVIVCSPFSSSISEDSKGKIMIIQDHASCNRFWLAQAAFTLKTLLSKGIDGSDSLP